MFNKHQSSRSKPITSILIAALLSVTGATQTFAEPQPSFASTLLPFVIYGSEGAVSPNSLFLGTPTDWGYSVPKRGFFDAGSIKTEPTKVGDSNGIKVTWTGGMGQIYALSQSSNNQLHYLNAKGALVFDAIVHKKPRDQVSMRIDCGYPCRGSIDMTKYYRDMPLDTMQTVKIPLACFAKTGTKFAAVNTPWLIFTAKPFAISVANIRWVPGAGQDPDAVKCGN